MLKLLDPGTVPPGGFRYLCPETQTWVSAASFGELVSVASRHRTGNKLGVPDEFKEQVEAQLCSHMPPGTCKHDAGTVMTGNRRLSFHEVVAATKTLGAWFLKGTPKVAQAEADRRANICLSCPMNQDFDGCTTCAEKDLREAIVDFMGVSRTAMDAALHTCGVCGCTLKAAVWMPLDLLLKHADKQALANAPAWCWKTAT